MRESYGLLVTAETKPIKTLVSPERTGAKGEKMNATTAERPTTYTSGDGSVYFYANAVQIEPYKTDIRSFEVFDKSGREIGAVVWSHVYENVPCSAPADPRDAARVVRMLGVVYAFTPNATRNGRTFGKSNGERAFATRAERDAAIETYFAEAKARAVKAAR